MDQYNTQIKIWILKLQILKERGKTGKSSSWHFYSETAYHRIKAAYSNTDKLDVPFQKKEEDKLDVPMYSKGLTEINRQK